MLGRCVSIAKAVILLQSRIHTPSCIQALTIFPDVRFYFRFALDAWTQAVSGTAKCLTRKSLFDFRPFFFLVRWPRGTYALPMAVTGCPKSRRILWSEGYLRQNTEDTSPLNNWSRPMHLKGLMKNNEITQHFCVKNKRAGHRDWPKGKYCIYKKGTCPSGKDTAYYNACGRRFFFCLRLHAHEAYVSIHWKMTR